MITISDATALCNFVQQEESSNTSSMRAFLSYTRCRNAMACCSKALISSRASSTAVTKQNVIFSGIQPTGESPSEQRALQAETMSTKVHHTYVPTGQLSYLALTIAQLGNYLGLFLPFLEMQASAPAQTPIYLSIVGLHAITLPQDPVALVRDRRDMLASLLACGVDPERTCVFFQEDVGWVSACIGTRLTVLHRSENTLNFHGISTV